MKLTFTNDGIYGIDENGDFVCGKSTKYNIISVPDENGRSVSTDLFEYIGDRKVVDIAASGNALALVLDDGEIVVSGMKEPQPQLPEGENALTVSGGTRHFVLTTDQAGSTPGGRTTATSARFPKL